MTPIDKLDMPAEIIARLKSAGFASLEGLCKTPFDVGTIVSSDRPLETTRQLRIAMAKLGIDPRNSMNDPPGTPVTPSRKILLTRFELLDLAPKCGSASRPAWEGRSTVRKSSACVILKIRRRWKG